MPPLLSSAVVFFISVSEISGQPGDSRTELGRDVENIRPVPTYPECATEVHHEEDEMKYLLLMAYGEIEGVSPMDGQGLAGPEAAKIVVTTWTSAPVISDGPFPWLPDDPEVAGRTTSIAERYDLAMKAARPAPPER